MERKKKRYRPVYRSRLNTKEELLRDNILINSQIKEKKYNQNDNNKNKE